MTDTAPEPKRKITIEKLSVEYSLAVNALDRLLGFVADPYQRDLDAIDLAAEVIERAKKLGFKVERHKGV